MTGKETAAVVGAVGGAGATRLSVELAATLARAGRDAAVLDAAFATAGLSSYVSGPLDPDLTAVVDADGPPLDDALVDLDHGTPGRLALCPARGSFGRLARAKTPAAAERFEATMADAAAGFDHVLVDAGPVAANQAVAAASAADRVAVVAPPTGRGTDAVQRVRGRLADVGEAADLTVANPVPADATSDPPPGFDRAVPASQVETVPAVPAALARPEAPFAPAVAALAEVLFDAPLGLTFEEEGSLDAARRYVSELSPVAED